MPAIPAVPGVIRFDLTGTIGTDTQTHNRFYMSFSGAASPTNMNTLATLVRTAWVDTLKPLLSNDSAISNWHTTDLSSLSGAQGNDGTNVPGTSGGPSVSAQACLVINFQVGRRYRGGKPKFFLAGGPAAELADANAWDPTLVDNINTQWGDFIAAIIAGAPGPMGTLAHVNVSFYEGFTSIENPLTHRYRNIPTLRADPVVDAIDSHSVDVPIGSQRRRTRA